LRVANLFNSIFISPSNIQLKLPQQNFKTEDLNLVFQVMYMYYLLGHRLMELPISVDRKEVMAENTYLLTLDGDIDFQPLAVQLLVDLMKKNRNLGAACGRIHPVGSGANF
jgi:hypothetical protein